MPAYPLGAAIPGSPFNRTFFNVTLGDLIEKDGKKPGRRLLLYLADGSMLEVEEIEELEDAYLTLRAVKGSDEEGAEPSTHLLPYTLIYRIELSPARRDTSHVGFQWKPKAGKSSGTRRARK